jgi:hypothetical protein
MIDILNSLVYISILEPTPQGRTVLWPGNQNFYFPHGGNQCHATDIVSFEKTFTWKNYNYQVFGYLCSL